MNYTVICPIVPRRCSRRRSNAWSEYSLTARGQSLMPHVSALIGWALEHFEEMNKE